MNLGKQKRLSRILSKESSRSVIIPLDHGTTIGPCKGIENIQETVNDMVEGKANALVMHKGMLRNSGCCNNHQDTGLILHLSASTSLSPLTNTKAIVGTVEEGLMYGADAISIHVNLGDENEAQMLRDAGMIAEACERWGMPLMMMLYGRGPKIQNQYDPNVVAHCARLGAELGADIVKVGYTGDVESFSRVVESCCVPVVIAGGDKLDTDKDILQMAYDSIRAGGSGLSIGRNVFQSNNRIALMHALNAIVHQGLSVEEALTILTINLKKAAKAA